MMKGRIVNRLTYTVGAMIHQRWRMYCTLSPNDFTRRFLMDDFSKPPSIDLDEFE